MCCFSHYHDDCVVKIRKTERTNTGQMQDLAVYEEAQSSVYEQMHYEQVQGSAYYEEVDVIKYASKIALHESHMVITIMCVYTCITTKKSHFLTFQKFRISCTCTKTTGWFNKYNDGVHFHHAT